MTILLNKEAAVWLPTGTLANHLAIRKHCAELGTHKAIVSEQSHLNIALVPLGKNEPNLSLALIKEHIEGSKSDRVPASIGVISIESPVRRHNGRVLPIEEITVRIFQDTN